MKNIKPKLLLLLFVTSLSCELFAYPFDGYALTGIARLLRLQLIHSGEMEGKFGPEGKYKTLNQIDLYLREELQIHTLPEVDPDLQQALEEIIPDRHKSYSVSIMNITPCQEVRYASRQENRGFQPGSVGKLAVITGLFCELQNLYPESFDERQNLLKTKRVRAGVWAMSDHHTVPFFDVETKKYFKRTVRESDVFSLYEWADHMMSVSNNGAASVVWREVLLMREFGDKYPELTDQQADQFFKEADKKWLTEVGMSVVNDPLRELGITEDEWRLGTFFTRGASSKVRGKGGSIGTPRALMKWMVALESGNIVDPRSSLEIKRLLYITDRRIRYASARELDKAAVYFKSGSLYKCNRTTMPSCGKYKGNVYNYMNSVAIVEQPDGTVYLVALMTNVLRRNSAWDHRQLAKDIDRIVREINGSLSTSN